MRASYLSDECVLDEQQQLIRIRGEECHHLIVTRIKIDDSLMILDGAGKSYKTKVIQIDKKKEIQVSIIEGTQLKRSHHISLALGIPKKEAFDRSLQIAQEFNVKDIIPLDCDFTQFKGFKMERLYRILTGALKQSNSSYLASIGTVQKINEIDFTKYSKVVYLDPYTEKTKFNDSFNCGVEDILLLVGPEGGFSEAELMAINKIENLSRLKICDSILRVETCVASALGYLHHYDGRE